MRYVIDIDGTICSPTVGRNYHEAEPWYDRIERVNKMYDEGHYIIYFTARAMGRFNGDSQRAIDAFYNFTQVQLESWGCKYHKLILGKPHVDLFVDDKGINSEDFFK